MENKIENSMKNNMKSPIENNIKIDMENNCKTSEIVYDLTNPQKSIWVTEQYFSGSSINNICGTVLIDEVVNFEILEKAINIMVKQSDNFRIRLFLNDDGEIKQRFLSPLEIEYFNIPILDLNDLKGLEDLEKRIASTHLDIFNKPLFNFIMFRLPNGTGGYILCASHFIVDACSSNLIGSISMNIYSHLLKGETCEELQTSYIDYIHSEKEYLTSSKFEKAKAFWESYFSTVPELGVIPSSKNIAKESCSAARKQFVLPQSQVELITKFCSDNKVSVFNFFMAVYAIYIGKVSNLNDFVLGTPILNRSNFAEKNTPGMFISTMPIRFLLDNDLPVLDFMKKIATDSLSLFRYQKYPYQNILEFIRKTNPSQPNLYDILISYQNTKANKETSIVPFELRWTCNDNVADSIQIHLFDMNDFGSLNIAYDYRLNKYDESDILNIHNRICYIIEQILSTSKVSTINTMKLNSELEEANISNIKLSSESEELNKPITIGNIEIVTPKEKQVILYDFNNSYLKYDENKNIIAFFEEQVSKTPDNIAIVFKNNSLTYKQLNEKVNSLAYFLRTNGVSNNSIVGVMQSRSFEMMVSILAVLKAGGAYIPIDPEYPEERISYMLTNSKSPILITSKHLEAKIKNICFDGDTIFADLDNKNIYDLPCDNINNISSPDDLSYIIFTSGSTGLPKGVMLTHRNLSNFVSSMIDKIAYLNDGIYHSIVSITTVSFDIFAFETLVSLCKGLKLFITDESEQKITLKLERLIMDNNIEIIQSTPSIMNFHIESLSMNGFSKLKYIMLAGEQLPKSLVDKLKNISPDCTVYNGYGPSETTIFSTIKDVTNLESINIGEPISNTQVYIVNNGLSLLPINTVGEIYIAGDGVGAGYLYRDDLTCQRYIKNPFKENSIMYKTGDLGLWLPNGSIECHGRADNQVKLRGLRIELGEIEECICNFDKSSDIKCAVIIKDSGSKSSLNAFISSSKEFSVSELENYLLNYLPTYMIPSSFTILDKLPFTPNGKIDRKALNNYTINSFKSSKVEMPQTSTQKYIWELVSRLVNNTCFGIKDSFFNIGLDSLCIINLATSICAKFDTDVTVRDIYDAKNIETLALLVDELISNSSSTYNTSNIATSRNISDNNAYDACLKDNTMSYTEDYNTSCSNTNRKKDLYPTSSAQKRIYYSSKMAGEGSTLYNMPGAIVFKQKPDIKKLNECLQLLIQRHSSLRTYFVIQDGEVFQKISDSVCFGFEEKYESGGIEEALKNFVRPFDFSCAPLFRCRFVTFNNNCAECDLLKNSCNLEAEYDLLKNSCNLEAECDLLKNSCNLESECNLENTSKNSYALLFDLHHIICDGLSLEILASELCKLYNDEVLCNLPFEYIDYSEEESYHLSHGLLDEAKDFWINSLENLPALNIPLDYPRPATKSFEGEKICLEIEANKINELAKKLNVSTYMLLLSAFYVLLNRYSSQEDIVIGSPIVGRDSNKFLNIIGMFVNTLPLKNHVNSNMNFTDFLSTVKDNCIKSINFSTYPFDVLVNDLGIFHDSSRNPIFDVMFTYQNNGLPTLDFQGMDAKFVIPDTKISKFDLSLEVVPSGDNFKLNFEYCTKLFNKVTIERLANHFIHILERIVDNSDVKIGDIDIFSTAEKNMILKDFNNTKLDYRNYENYITLFYEQVYRTPNKTAVIFGNDKLTYKELNEKSNQIAHYLIENGVKINDFIGVLVTRSLELICAMLGILKAGAAYLPIDPSYPNSRISYMIDDSNVNIILSQKTLIEKLKLSNSVALDDSIFNKFDTTDVHIPIASNNFAYLIYTSGSTGKPKGVIINHQNINNFIAGICEKIDFSSDKNIVSITTMCFDIFVLETLLPLQKGMTIVLANEDEQTIPKKLNLLCQKHNVDIIQTTPSKLGLLMVDSNELDFIRNMNCILLGGEPFPQKLLADLKGLTSSKIYNVYGPTETTVWSSVKDLTFTNDITIGKPIANTQMYVLDSKYNLVPVGVPGELFIGGDGISTGYFNKDTLTNERFVSNPFKEGTFIYKTGDLVKWLPSGEIEYIGRTDFQVKLHGLRIELGEIETALLKFPAITNCVVCMKTDSLDRQVLCAYIISSERVSISNLKNYLSSILPAYMVPTYIMQLDKFKFTPNGKIDRNALPSPTTSLEKKDIVLPETKTEQLLLSLWENLLGISPISIDDKFFTIGGDSILALRLQIELLNKNITVSYADIFKYDTIKSLALRIDSMSTTKTCYLAETDNNIQEILAKNTTSSLENLHFSDIGNVLLIGVTGFLGANILDNLLVNTNSNVYCLVRKDPSTNIKEKVLNRLHFYFGNKFDHFIDNRIFIIESDITTSNLGLDVEMQNDLASKVDCIINSAAIVKHYGYYSEFEKVNVTGVQNLVDFCLKYDKKFVQISTTSVSGNTLTDLGLDNNTFESEVPFTETDLYINQSLDNVYVRSKFEAEKFILSKIYTDSLNALILRVGNITSRFSDGIFQHNASENAFMNRLKAFLTLGAIPDYLLSSYMEFTPADCLSDAIIKSIQYWNGEFSVLHLYNNNHVFIGDFINMLPSNLIKVTTEEDFRLMITNYFASHKHTDTVAFLSNDMDVNKKLIYSSNIKIKNEFSNLFLNKIGFSWPTIDLNYINFLLKTLGM